MEAQYLSRLTERFYRVRQQTCHKGGAGLGLAIVRHILQRHEATLEIESIPGAGSVFRCRFPASRLLPETR